jgi:hypothetical protein
MLKTIFLFLFTGACLNAQAQRASTREKAPPDTAIYYKPDPPSIDIEIKKFDSAKVAGIKGLRFYKLSVLNSTDSAICILFSFDLERSLKRMIYALDPAYDCTNNTGHYYSLEYCRNWDMGYLPLPAKPFLLNPNTYLLTNFSIPDTPGHPKEFHLHYASVDMSYTDLQKAYKSDRHYWHRSLAVKCKIVKLPE